MPNATTKHPGFGISAYENAQCTGSESELLDCSHSSNINIPGSCSFAGVSCSNSNVDVLPPPTQPYTSEFEGFSTVTDVENTKPNAPQTDTPQEATVIVSTAIGELENTTVPILISTTLQKDDPQEGRVTVIAIVISSVGLIVLFLIILVITITISVINRKRKNRLVLKHNLLFQSLKE